MEKRILILTAGFGEGHNAAARGIEAGLRAVAGEGALVQVRDLFAETYGFANDWARHTYLALIDRSPRNWERLYRWIDARDDFTAGLRFLFHLKQRLRALLNQFQPHVVVSVYPAYQHLLDTIAPQENGNLHKMVCITDSITVNAIWFRCAADLFLVPNNRTADVLHAAGVARERVYVSGFPVSPKFAGLGTPRQPPSSEQRCRVLYMINSGAMEAPEIVRSVASLANVHLTVTVGRKVKLHRLLEAIRRQIQQEFDLIGWSDQLPRLMLESHLLISKAGGATVQEAIAACCPMIINQVVPGQEEGNARLIEEIGAGVVATKPEAIVRAVENAFANNSEQWRFWLRNMKNLSRPRAPFEIAELLLARATEPINRR